MSNVLIQRTLASVDLSVFLDAVGFTSETKEWLTSIAVQRGVPLNEPGGSPIQFPSFVHSILTEMLEANPHLTMLEIGFQKHIADDWASEPVVEACRFLIWNVGLHQFVGER